jgi:adenylyltransferase/sulfurtransferase
MSMERYRKHTLVPEIGEQGQAAIGRGRVLVVGAGGLGSAVLPYLAGAGVGRITLIDDDRVERSNLQRQVLFGESSLGTAKATAAAARLADLNAEIEIRALPARLDADNVGPLLAKHDVVVDGSDNYATKYLLADACVRFNRPLVYGSVTGMDALVSVFDASRGPCLRCLFPAPPDGWVPNCAQAGVLGPLVGVTGAMQATEAVKLLAGRADAGVEPMIGRLWTMDARSGESRVLRVQRRDDCAGCSSSARPVNRGEDTPLREIEIGEIARYPDWPLLDVREAEEYAAGHAPGAVSVPLSALQRGAAEVPADAPGFLVYCLSGQRCREAAVLLRRRFAVDVRGVRGGFEALRDRLPEAANTDIQRQTA